MQKKLYRSRTQRVFAGVCGGIAEYFNIDVTLVRLVWVILTLPGLFPGLLLYIVAALIIPEGTNAYHTGYEQGDAANSNGFYGEFKDYHVNDGRNKVYLIIGLILIIAGGMALFRNLFPSIWVSIRSLFKELVFPIFLIVLGGAIIYSATRK